MERLRLLARQAGGEAVRIRAQRRCEWRLVAIEMPMPKPHRAILRSAPHRGAGQNPHLASFLFPRPVCAQACDYFRTSLWRKSVRHCSPTPAVALHESYPGRFRLRRTSVGEILQALDEIRALLRAEAGEEVELVVTVSPVPIAATFDHTRGDVAVVNSGYKAMLRAAVEEWTAGHDDLHYYPGYEMVTCSAPARAWGTDARHPSSDMVRHVTSRFLDEFIVRNAR